MKYPGISIVIPSVGRDTLERTLNSIIECCYPNIEIIVSLNNNSFNRSIEIQSKYPKIKVITTDDKLFPFEAKNRGIKYSSKELLTFIDDDDTCLPAKFFDLSKYLEYNKNIFAVFGQYNVRDCYSGKIKNTNCGGCDRIDFATLLQQNYIASGSVMFRNTKEIYFKETPYGWGEDYDMSLRLIAKYKFHFLETPVYCWTQNLKEGYTATFKKNKIDWKPLTQDIIDHAKQNYKQ